MDSPAVASKRALVNTMEKSKEQIERSKDRVEAVALNKEIAQHASRKQLTEAMILFEKAVSLKWANSHTYAAAINANIRCGCVSGAANLFEELRKAKGIKLDVITCTTMMKGFCGEGDIIRSTQLIEEMDKHKILPNIRTINTFLRGCVITGEVKQAEIILAKTQKEYLLTPDVSTWEYIVTLLCQGLRLEKVLPIVGRLKGDSSMNGDLGGMNVNVARAASLLEDWKTCKRSLKSAIESLDLNEKQEENGLNEASLSDEKDGDEKDDENVKGYQREATGGKKAWKATEDDSRTQSLEIFRKHKREELRQEIAVIDTFMIKRLKIQEVKQVEIVKQRNLEKSAEAKLLRSNATATALVATNDTSATSVTAAVITSATSNTSSSATALSGPSTASTSEVATINTAKNNFSSDVNGSKGKGDTSLRNVENKLDYLMPFFSRVFSFPIPENEIKAKDDMVVHTDVDKIDSAEDGEDPDDNHLKNGITSNLLQSVRLKFGLDVCLEKFPFDNSKIILVDSTTKNVDIKVKSKEMKDEKVDVKPAPKSIETGDKDDDKNLTRKEKRKEEKLKSKKRKSEVLEKKELKAKKDLNSIQENNDERLHIFENILNKNLMNDGFIDFESVFSSSENVNKELESMVSGIDIDLNDEEMKVESDSLKKGVPLKIEICSGAGEWAVTQASADPESRWVTLELRHDRVYQTFTRAIYAGANNLCVMGGDATRVLPERIQTASVDHIFINHPEPPQQIGGSDSQGKHLLTLDFLGEISRILKPEGMLTIVTDNQWYGKFLMRLLSSQNQPSFLKSVSVKELACKAEKIEKNEKVEKSTEVKKNEKDSAKRQLQKNRFKNLNKDTGARGEWTILEEEGGVSLYTGRPGIECGIVVEASSYFDRLWKRDQKIERYFLVFKKGLGTPPPKSSLSSASAPIDKTNSNNIIHSDHVKQAVSDDLRINNSSNLAERAKKGGYAEKSMKAAAFLQSGGTNKKMKFDD